MTTIMEKLVLRAYHEFDSEAARWASCKLVQAALQVLFNLVIVTLVIINPQYSHTYFQAFWEPMCKSHPELPRYSQPSI